jgi:N-methylhydantoinase B
MTDVDPITLNIVGKSLQAIAREMAANMRRASYSSVVREARDFSVGILDVEGNVVAQAEMIPMQTGGISEAFKPVKERFDFSSLTTDDAFIMNDPFSGGQHLQDIFIYTPLFSSGELLGFAASVAHHVEVGGGMPGLNAAATEFYQEGLRFRASRFSRARDWDGGIVETFIRGNVRVPEKVIGDLNAQFSANNTADRRLNELVDRYGFETVQSTMAAIQDYAERRIRDGIRAIPDGTYRGADSIEARAWGLDPVPIVVEISVFGDALHVDFTGTGDQIMANINCPYASTLSAVQGAIRGVLHDEDIPFNGGCNRPISVNIPYGSILNPRPPAAVRARMGPACRVHNAIIRALSSALPERVISPGFDTTTALSVSHLDPETGEYGVVIEILGGGWGAGPSFDGMNGLDNPLSNCANAPVEALESEYPYFRVVNYELDHATGGEGRSRGGHGVLRGYEATRDGVVISAYSDRFEQGVTGILGGEAGSPGAFILRRSDGAEEHLQSTTSVTLQRGDVFIAHTGGGGGYGNSPASGLNESH